MKTNTISIEAEGIKIKGAIGFKLAAQRLSELPARMV